MPHHQAPSALSPFLGFIHEDILVMLQNRLDCLNRCHENFAPHSRDITAPCIASSCLVAKFSLQNYCRYCCSHHVRLQMDSWTMVGVPEEWGQTQLIN